MNELVNKETGEIVNFNPADTANISVMGDAAIQGLLKKKEWTNEDYDSYVNVVRNTIMHKYLFWNWWDGQDKDKGNQYGCNSTVTAMKLADYHVDKMQVSRWRKKYSDSITTEQVIDKEIEFGWNKLNNFDDKTAHVSNNSGENEWYTPKEYIESARIVMGSIDLDPASSKLANKTVKATKFFTAEDNGLEQEWAGNVWLNPPYAQPLISQFSKKVIFETLRTEVKQVIVLVNNATDTSWFQGMAEFADSICFVSGRIKFLDTDGNPGAPLQGQAILYFGESVQEFVDEFEKHGFTVIRHV